MDSIWYYSYVISLALAVAWLVVVNLWTYLLFAFDKHRARQGGRRVPEARLLRLAWFGGYLGAKLAQQRLRHKTIKQPFARYLEWARFAPVLWFLAIMLSPAALEALGPEQTSSFAQAERGADAVPYAAPSASRAPGHSLWTKVAPHFQAVNEKPTAQMPRRFGPGS